MAAKIAMTILVSGCIFNFNIILVPIPMNLFICYLKFTSCSMIKNMVGIFCIFKKKMFLTYVTSTSVLLLSRWSLCPVVGHVYRLLCYSFKFKVRPLCEKIWENCGLWYIFYVIFVIAFLQLKENWLGLNFKVVLSSNSS